MNLIPMGTGRAQVKEREPEVPGEDCWRAVNREIQTVMVAGALLMIALTTRGVSVVKKIVAVIDQEMEGSTMTCDMQTVVTLSIGVQRETGTAATIGAETEELMVVWETQVIGRGIGAWVGREMLGLRIERAQEELKLSTEANLSLQEGGRKTIQTGSTENGISFIYICRLWLSEALNYDFV
jgi:hypothetical protein